MIHCGVVLYAAKLQHEVGRVIILFDRAVIPVLRQVIFLLSAVGGLTASCTHRCEFLTKHPLVLDLVRKFLFGRVCCSLGLFEG